MLFSFREANFIFNDKTVLDFMLFLFVNLLYFYLHKLQSMKKCFLILFILLAMNIFFLNIHGQVLNEKWVSDPPGKEFIEIQFLQDSIFKYNGEHTNRWYSYAEGIYHFNQETGEIFISVPSGGFDWLQSERAGKNLPIYWGEIRMDYQLYFRIKKRTDTVIIADEYINSYHEDIERSGDLYEKGSIWKQEDGIFTFIGNNLERLVEREYRIVEADAEISL